VLITGMLQMCSSMSQTGETRPIQCTWYFEAVQTSANTCNNCNTCNTSNTSNTCTWMRLCSTELVKFSWAVYLPDAQIHRTGRFQGRQGEFAVAGREDIPIVMLAYLRLCNWSHKGVKTIWQSILLTCSSRYVTRPRLDSYRYH
jgi:hypothetical protein